jgi:hypothetical protein
MTFRRQKPTNATIVIIWIVALALSCGIAFAMDGTNGPAGNGPAANAGGQGGNGGDWDGPPRVNDGPKDRAGCRMCH